MKRLIGILCLLILTSCSDPSPIRSDIEVRYNKLFGTKFGVIDQVYFYSGEKKLDFIAAAEFLGYLENLKEIEKEEIDKDITILLKTSDGMKEYSKEQTSAKLYYDQQKHIVCSAKSCYKVPDSLAEKMKTYL